LIEDFLPELTAQIHTRMQYILTVFLLSHGAYVLYCDINQSLAALGQPPSKGRQTIDDDASYEPSLAETEINPPEAIAAIWMPNDASMVCLVCKVVRCT
jgi:hypothetical protein